MKWADYLISKEKWIPNKNTIQSFIVHDDYGDTVGSGTEKLRRWVVEKLKDGKTFKFIHRTEGGLWECGSSLTINQKGGLIRPDRIPLILPKRKTFISYYHKDDQKWKESFQNLTADLIVNKSVKDGDINSDVSDEYIKQLIQKGFLSDTTVLVVLLGPKTKCRKHVDWEISGALNLKVGEHYSGLLGLMLPTHPDYGTGRYTYSEQPQRLTDNLKSRYALIRDYTTDRKKLQEYIELAYKKRTSNDSDRTNSRIQMKKDTCS